MESNTKERDQQEADLLKGLMLEWLNGDEDAAQFCMLFMYIIHLWDDLIDGDKERDKEHINDAFWMLFVEIPKNSFYLENFRDLQPLIEHSIVAWHTANGFEKGGLSHELDISYTLRCSVINVVEHCALICGGFDHARTACPEIRRYSQSETLQAYKEDLCQH